MLGKSHRQPIELLGLLRNGHAWHLERLHPVELVVLIDAIKMVMSIGIARSMAPDLP
jgi:hypothetical protein